MPIEGFNYIEFAETLAAQADDLVPAEFEPFQKQYVSNTIKNFATLSAEAIVNDDKMNFTVEQAMLLTQIIAEWSFHKSIDLIRAGILPDYWDSVMQKIAFTIFEMAKQTISKGLPQDEILQIVEHHVKKAYNNALDDLKQRNIIDESVFERAVNQSNIDEMMQQMQEETQDLQQAQTNEGTPAGQSNAKILKLASLALLLKQVPQDKVHSILNKFDPEDAQTVIQYMQMPDLEQKVDKNIAVKCLQEIKTNLPEPKRINPSKIIGKISKIFDEVPREKIERAIIKERSNVKELLNKAREGESINMPPKVANIIAQHLEESVL